MQDQQTGPLAEFGQRFFDYLPTLAAGLVIAALGVVVGWIAKRAVVRVLIWLRLDRIGGRYGWQAAFGKGDVRAALYNLVGSIVWVLIALVFLDNALQIWRLTVLSRLVDGLIFYVPNLLLVGLIVGVGVLLANAVANRIEDALEEEQAPRPQLLAKIFKGALLTLVGALALWQLNLAREMVLAAFLIGFGAAGVAFALAVGIGSARAIQRGWENRLEKKKDR